MGESHSGKSQHYAAKFWFRRHLRSSSLEDRCPYLDLLRRAVSPSVVRNERELNPARLARFCCVTVVQSAARLRLLVNRPGVVQNNDSVEQVSLEFFVEPRARVLLQIQGNLRKFHSGGLVELFETIDQRARLHSDAPVILDDVGIAVEDLRRHLELHVNRVT